jgi:stringent starvation protein B
MNGTPLPPKKEVALALLERGSVHVHLDPRAGGVVVPAWFKRQPQLVLQVGLNMPVPIPDLRVDEDGMSCTLSFNRSPFFCIVPWSAVFAMVGDDSRGMVWPDDVPPEVATQARGREAEPAKKPSPPRALTSVKPPPPEVARPLAVKSAVKSTTKTAAKTAAKAGAKPRAVRAEAGGTAKPKKPRAKKGTSPVAAAPEAPKTSARGVLISIPSPSAAPQPARATPEPARTAPTPLRASPAPEAASPSKPEAPPPPPPAAKRPAGGKAKREIPPYLRVVK